MLLTDTLIEDLHHFRIEMMRRSVGALQVVSPSTVGKSTGGGYAKFAGDGSPITQVYGVGHRGVPVDFAEIDEFYRGLTRNWEMVITPFAGSSVLGQAVKFGYVPDHIESVLAQHAEPATVDTIPGMEITVVDDDLSQWMKTSESGWSDRDELVDEFSELTQVLAAYPARRYLALVDNEPAATASLISIDGRYMFAGACTRPKFRRRGLQRALTQRRLSDAGVGSFVQVVAIPGSQSHRNLQRVGFQPLYSKLVMFRRENN